jgi:prophage maintenance system killer protein
MTEERKQSLHEISILLCEAYKELLYQGEVAFELGDEHVNKVDSIVKTIYSKYFGVQRFQTLEDKAAAFFCYIIKGHVFPDGNKGMATLWLEIYLNANNLKIANVPLDVLAVSIEKTNNDTLYETTQIVKEILFD